MPRSGAVLLSGKLKHTSNAYTHQNWLLNGKCRLTLDLNLTKHLWVGVWVKCNWSLLILQINVIKYSTRTLPASWKVKVKLAKRQVSFIIISALYSTVMQYMGKLIIVFNQVLGMHRAVQNDWSSRTNSCFCCTLNKFVNMRREFSVVVVFCFVFVFFFYHLVFTLRYVKQYINHLVSNCLVF